MTESHGGHSDKEHYPGDIATVSATEAARMFAAARDSREEVLGVLDGAPLLLVDLERGGDVLVEHAPPSWLPCVVLGVAASARGRAPDGVDIAMAPGELGTAPAGWVALPDPAVGCAVLGRGIGAGPLQSVTLAQVLRTSDHLDIEAGLVLESLAYSTLQGGHAFTTWLDSRTRSRPTDDPEHVVLVERGDDVLRITLNRPQVRNAISRQLRDELCEALAIAGADPSIRVVELRGAGPAFCSGGDLNEFGTLPEPVTGHLVRISRSPGRLLAALAPRVTAFVHGACVGGGVELAVFARKVFSTPDASFSLPEIGLGLIPGAGGTVSISRRIGRQRAAWLALTGATIDAHTALNWGLVDELTDGDGR